MFTMKASYLILLASLLTPHVACGQPHVRQVRGTSSAVSQEKAVYLSLKAQAEQWAEAYVREDYMKVVSLMNPKQVELAGGPEQAARILSSNLKPDGVKMLTIQVEEPEEIVSIEGQIFAIVPTKLKMREPRGVLVGNGFLIGASNDSGESWTFVDGSGGRAEVMVKTLLPAAAGKLRLPKLKPLVLTTEP